MDLIEKCKAAGIGDGAAYEGYPVVDGKVFKRVNGALKAFTRREDPRPFADLLIENTEFDPAILAKIQAIEDGKLDQLHQDEQDAIAAAEAEEQEKVEAPTLVELTKRVGALEATIAE